MALSEAWLKANHNKDREKTLEQADRDAMSVRVSPKGKITFQLRYRQAGKAARIDIGSYPLISLKEAREKSIALRAQIEQGHDPRIERRLKDQALDSTNITLKELFAQWDEKYLDRSKRSRKEIVRSFEIHVFDKLGDLPADRLTINHWLNLLEPLAKVRPAITERILANAKQMMNWAIRRQICSQNPLANIDASDDLHIEYKPTDRVLSDREVALVWGAMMRSRMLLRNRIFMQLLFIYGCRSGELRAARKVHIDREKMTWTVPPENHKMGDKTAKPIIRPLIPQTIRLFDIAQTLNDSEYLFVSSRNRQNMISRGALLGLPYDLMAFLDREENIKMNHWSLHDIRRTMRTNMSSITEPHIAEIMLGHTLPLIWRTYDQHDYLEEQRAALVKWCERIQAIIVPYPLV